MPEEKTSAGTHSKEGVAVRAARNSQVSNKSVLGV